MPAAADAAAVDAERTSEGRTFRERKKRRGKEGKKLLENENETQSGEHSCSAGEGIVPMRRGRQTGGGRERGREREREGLTHRSGLHA